MTNPTQPDLRARAALSEAELADVQRLAARCRLHAIEPRLVWAALIQPGEQPSHFLYYDAERLVGFLSVDGIEGDEPEGMLLVDPAALPDPIVGALLDAVRVVRDSHTGGPLLLVVDRRAEPLTDALRERGLALHMTECLMLRAPAPAPELAGELLVARATPADSSAIAAILGEDLGIAPDELLTRVSLNMHRPGFSYTIAYLAGDPVGTLNVQILNDQPFIYGFVVRPEFRGRRFGRQILAYALADLQRDGPQEVYLEVEPDNTPALRLYESLGFELKVTYDYYRDQRR